MARLLALLLIAHGAAEWVEISQQHYRKPIRTHTHFTSDRVIDVEDTTTPWSYDNHSVVEYNWNKNPATPNAGNVKRMQHVETTTKVNKRLHLDDDDDDLELNVDFRHYQLGPTKPTTEINKPDKQKGTIERVSNLGNIKRVQLNSSPVKSPVIHNKGDDENYFTNRHENVAYSDSVHTETDELGANKKPETFHRKIYISNLKKHSTERYATFPPDEDEIITFNMEATPIRKTDKSHFKNQTVRNFYSTKPTFITETEDFTNYETEQDRFYKILNRDSTETNKKDNFATEIINTSEDSRTKPNTKSTTIKVNSAEENSYELKTESNPNNVFEKKHEKNENVTSVVSTDFETKTKHPVSPPIQADHNKNEIKNKKDGTNNTKNENNNKVNAIENLIKFMKVVADTISKNSRRNFRGKIQYLHELKDTILTNIGKFNLCYDPTFELSITSSVIIKITYL